MAGDVPTKHIVAIGGAGLSAEDNYRLERYIVGLTGKERPRVCSIGTASGDSEWGRERFYAAAAVLGWEATHLALIPNPTTADPASVLLDQDVLYVGGGNTRNMLALWREWGIGHLVRAAWERGTVLAGPSAGMICWFAEGITDSVPGPLTLMQCLGFLPGSACPHYDSEPMRRPTYTRLIGAGLAQPGYAVDDAAALHFTGTDLAHVIAARPTARAYRVERGADGATETPLTPDYLSDEPQGESNRNDVEMGRE